jgi:hypothetical protein
MERLNGLSGTACCTAAMFIALVSFLAVCMAPAWSSVASVVALVMPAVIRFAFRAVIRLVQTGWDWCCWTLNWLVDMLVVSACLGLFVNAQHSMVMLGGMIILWAGGRAILYIARSYVPVVPVSKSRVGKVMFDEEVDMDARDDALPEAPTAFRIPSDPMVFLRHIRRHEMDGPLGPFRPRTVFLPNLQAPTAVPLITEQDVACEEMRYQLGQVGKNKTKFDTTDDPNVPDCVEGGEVRKDGWTGTAFANVDHCGKQQCVCLLWFEATALACPSCKTPASGVSTNGNGSPVQGAASGASTASGAPSSGSATSGFVFGVQPASSAGSSATQSTGGAGVSTNGNGSPAQGAASGASTASGAPCSGSTTSGFVFGVQPASSAGSSATLSTGDLFLLDNPLLDPPWQARRTRLAQCPPTRRCLPLWLEALRVHRQL